MYGLSERWLGWPSAVRLERAAISRTRGDEFPQPFGGQKWQSLRRGHTDSNGSPLTTLSYDAWGTVLTNTTPGSSDRYQYTAREWDPVMHLWYNRARVRGTESWYSVDQGVLMLGENQYAYTRNNSTILIDPSGRVGINIGNPTATAHQQHDIEWFDSLARDDIFRLCYTYFGANVTSRDGFTMQVTDAVDGIVVLKGNGGDGPNMMGHLKRTSTLSVSDVTKGTVVLFPNGLGIQKPPPCLQNGVWPASAIEINYDLKLEFLVHSPGSGVLAPHRRYKAELEVTWLAMLEVNSGIHITLEHANHFIDPDKGYPTGNPNAPGSHVEWEGTIQGNRDTYYASWVWNQYHVVTITVPPPNYTVPNLPNPNGPPPKG